MKEYSWHVYDINLNRAYQDMVTQIKQGNYHFPKNDSLKQEQYLDLMKYFIINYCKNHPTDENPDFYLNNPTIPLVPPIDIEPYESYLGYTLLAFDVYKIIPFLSYQKDKRSNDPSFVNKVEYLVYSYVKENSAFDLKERLKMITEWVVREREKTMFQCNYSGQVTERILTKEQIVVEVQKENPYTYDNVLQDLFKIGKLLEEQSDMHCLDEETIRLFFLNPLALKFTEGTVTAESLSMGRKTDIYVKHADGTVLFIGECKIWHGPQSLTEALDQLVSQQTFRNKELALILFVKEVGIEDILEKIKVTTLEWSKKVRLVRERNRSSFSFEIPYPGDAVPMSVEIMAFHLPGPHKLNTVKDKKNGGVE
jgi:hypothetical protein